MKKYKIYIVAAAALVIGAILGGLLLSNLSMANQEQHNEQETNELKSEIWTCSMHPQIRQNEPGACPICGMDLIKASQANTEDEISFQMTEEAIKLANVQTTIIGDNTLEGKSNLKLNGKIKADETKSSSLVSHIPGRIEKLYVSFTGDYIRKGQKIAKIYSPDLLTAQKELLEAQKIKDISPELLNAARNKLKYWKINAQMIDNILLTGEISETFDVYAEYSGIVDKKRVSVGDYLKKGEVLFDIQNLSSVWAIFDVYESDIPKIKMGDKVSFTTPSTPDMTFNAEITFINPVINPQTRAASIRAEVNNTKGILKPEMFITGQLKIDQKSSYIIVPKSAVLWTGKRSVVYVKSPNSHIPSFEFREVTLGNSTDNGYRVLDGIDQGEEIVTNGAFVIDASAQLNNYNSMMNRSSLTGTKENENLLPDFTSEVAVEFKVQITTLAESYLKIKDALVESKPQKASEASEKFLINLNKVDMSLLESDAHDYWMEQQTALLSHGKSIQSLENLEKQREQFDFLSRALINTLKAYGVKNDTLYVQHCPMANDNNGADWLSKDKNILNPYFGNKMLTCGTTEDTIGLTPEKEIYQENDAHLNHKH